MKVHVAILLLLGLGTTVRCSGDWESLLPRSPGESAREQMAPVLREIAHTLEDRIFSTVLLDPEDQLMFHAQLSDVLGIDTPEPEEYLDCGECRLFLGSFMGLLGQGLGFEELRPLAIEICEEVTTNLNWRGDIICEGIIDNFGPHVVWILNETELNANGVCQKYRLCPETSNDDLPIIIDFFPPVEDDVKESRQPKERNLDDMIKIVQLTDIHVDELYAEGSPVDCGLPICCRDQWNGTGEAGPWGESSCHLPPRVINLLLDYLAEMNPDFIVYTGDNAPSAMWMETFESQVQSSLFVTQALRDHIPGVPAFPTIGNHESYPTNLYYAPLNYTHDFNAAYLDTWRDLAGFGEEEAADIMVAGYYQKLLTPGLRLLSYNSNYGYTDNFYGILNENEPAFLKMLDFMENTFDLARENGEKIFLVSHHPIGSSGYFKYYDTVIDDIVTRNGDIIIIQPQGHTHSNNLYLTLNADSGEPVSVWLSTAAVVGVIQTATARVFYLDAETFAAVDYDTYHLDLEAALKAGKADPELKLMYRASEEYGVPDLSPQSMFNLTQRFEVDDELWDQYRYNVVSRRYVPGPCLGACRDSEICRMRSTTYDKYQVCQAQAASRRNGRN